MLADFSACQKVLFMGPVGVAWYLKKKKISTRPEFFLNLKKKMRNVIMLSTKCSLGKGFRLLKTLSTNNGFERSDLIFWVTNQKILASESL